MYEHARPSAFASFFLSRLLLLLLVNNPKAKSQKQRETPSSINFVRSLVKHTHTHKKKKEEHTGQPNSRHLPLLSLFSFSSLQAHRSFGQPFFLVLVPASSTPFQTKVKARTTNSTPFPPTTEPLVLLLPPPLSKAPQGQLLQSARSTTQGNSTTKKVSLFLFFSISLMF